MIGDRGPECPFCSYHYTTHEGNKADGRPVYACGGCGIRFFQQSLLGKPGMAVKLTDLKKETNVANGNLICPNCDGLLIRTAGPPIGNIGYGAEHFSCNMCAGHFYRPYRNTEGGGKQFTQAGTTTTPENALVGINRKMEEIVHKLDAMIVPRCDAAPAEPVLDIFHCDLPLLEFARSDVMALAGIENRSFGVKRSSQWPRVSRDYLKEHPQCEVTGSKVGVVVHHIIPVHVDPNKELDEDNFITLAPFPHLLVGHLQNWRSFNADVRNTAKLLRAMIAQRPHATSTPPV